MPLSDEIDALQQTFNAMQEAARLDPYPSTKVRRANLIALKQLLQNHGTDFVTAVSEDFTYRAPYETLLMEIFPSINTINYCLKELKHWTKDEKRKVSWLFKPAYAYLSPQPLGMVGIVVPWNYPLFLALEPLTYALAAGNKVMIKFAELTSSTGHLLDRLIKQSKLNDQVRIIHGGGEVAKIFSSLAWDHLLFTGSTAVGKQVMAKAAQNLSPVTLELGGKSPAIVSASVRENNLNRLFMGKIVNAGQTCIAPDYLLIPKGWEDKIVTLAKKFVEAHYPGLPSNPDYSSIISLQHKARLTDILADAKHKGARVVQIGQDPIEDQKMPIFLLFNVDSSMQVMQEEIFGPILPILYYSHFDEVIDQINALPRALTVYYFGESKEEKNKLKRQTCSGALSINDTLTHAAIDDLPFGGVGYSGMGQYHGKEGFNTFSQLKPVFVQRRFSPVTWFYPPFGLIVRYFLSWIVGIKKLKGKYID